ncbi:DnaJ C-terminal domain-containing protein [Thauera mechernichensis]
MPDAHHLLGLQPGASRAQIKRAFRQLAMQWHPDRNPAPDAVEHFKALRRAHDALLEALLEDTDADVETAATEAAEHAQQRATERGADRWETLEISFEEAFAGGARAICVRSPLPCAHCNGSGTEEVSVSQVCALCHGSGRLRTAQGLVHCDACDGRGYTRTRACRACGGSGEQVGERWLEVTLPPGLVDDDTLRLAGEGEPHADPGHPRGDLRLRVRLSPHRIFRREGRNLVVQRPVSALRMLVGGSLRIPHPAGMRSVTLDAGLAHCRQLHVEGAGFPARAGRAAGDLIVEFIPMLPEALDARVRALIEQLDNELGASAERHLPELARWEADWLTD